MADSASLLTRPLLSNGCKPWKPYVARQLTPWLYVLLWPEQYLRSGARRGKGKRRQKTLRQPAAFEYSQGW